MKTLAIVGGPATGKSTLVKRVIEHLNPGIEIKTGKMRYSQHGRIAVLGAYSPNEKFPGTDRLPMNVQPEAIEFLRRATQDGIDTILMEGDRLSNPAFFQAALVLGFQLSIYRIRVSDEVLQKRRSRRKQNQSWSNGRDTKASNVLNQFGGKEIWNDTKEHLEQNVMLILSELKNQEIISGMG